MFIGHFAVALASKKVAKKSSLTLLMMAAGFVDLLWPCFVYLGLEHVRIAPGITAFTPFDFYDYPLSHSLMADLFWALLFSGIYFLYTRYQRESLTLFFLVLSHWFLDVASHRPDMPIWLFGGPYLGLGLWYSVPWTIVIETCMFLLGIRIYLHSTRAKNVIGQRGFYIYMLFLYVVYLTNAFGPPPPSTAVIPVMAPVSLFLFWVLWRIELHRASI